MPAGKLILAVAVTLMLSGAGGQQAGNKPKPEADKQESGILRGLKLLQSGARVIRARQKLTPDEERALGREVAKKVFLRYGPRVGAPGLNSYVTLVGRTVAERAGDTATRYRFAIVKNRQPNAFAAPGGYVFITTGLMKKLRSEAQLAGVLGHEIAHVSKKHMARVIQRSRQLEGMAEISSVLLNKNPAELSRLVNRITDILFTRGLDKNMEYEADKFGTQYAAGAGYDAGGLKDFLVKLKKAEGREQSIFFQTHPPTGGRIARLERDILPRYRGGKILAERFIRFVR